MFTPSGGGHAPGHLREEFADLVDDYFSIEAGAEPLELMQKLDTLTGKLWNCTDQLPSSVRSDFENIVGVADHMPNTYAQAARMLRPRLRRHHAQAA